ncbi:hypothetical protein MNBD_BACTEROID07-73 [hydrothermal vent metagenome]|uniref:Uncharacterized protein n=1 Tax=hydrothermal vent metagenome TaxID=652676 RepID=A0A3B0V255_9ZZZZ
MWQSNWDYNPETDKLPKNITIIIVVASIAAAVYLSYILV